MKCQLKYRDLLYALYLNKNAFDTCFSDTDSRKRDAALVLDEESVTPKEPHNNGAIPEKYYPIVLSNTAGEKHSSIKQKEAKL